MVRMVTKVWKRGLLLACFLSMTEGLSWWTRINQRECVGWLFFEARFGSNSVLLVIQWLVCDTDSPRDIREWMLSITSSCPLFMFSFFPEHAAKSYWKDWATWGGEAEPRGLNGLLSKIKGRSCSKKIEEKQLKRLEEETSKLAERVTVELVIYEEHMSDCHTLTQAKIQQGLDEEPVQRYQRKEFAFHWAKWMHPCNVLEWK